MCHSLQALMSFALVVDCVAQVHQLRGYPQNATSRQLQSCSDAGTDRWGPNRGGCCSGLQECVEPRPLEDSHYCPTKHPQHQESCWSYIVMCRSECGVPTASPVTCAAFGQWPSVDNGVTCGGCTALVETAPYGGKCDAYCRSFGHVCISAAEEVNDNCEVKYIGSCDTEIHSTSDMLCTCQAESSTPAPTPAPTPPSTASPDVTCAAFSQWPSVDNGVTCGVCTALVETAPYGGKCDAYCRSFGHACILAAEEVNDNCDVKYIGSCDAEIHSTSDMLCTCQAEASTPTLTPAPTPPPTTSPDVTCAAFSQWPSVDNGVTCGRCTALVETAPYGGQCDAYCRSFGHACVSAAEEVNDNCDVKYKGSCESEVQSTSDMLCTCRAPAESDYDLIGRGVAGPKEIWIAKGLGVLACYMAVMEDSRCTKDYFTYVTRGDANCGCKGSNEELSVRGDEDADYYYNQLFLPSPSGNVLKVMSYNTEFKGYWDGRLNAFGQKISDVGAGIVGVQECQDVSGLARASGYEYLQTIGNRNPILYNSKKVAYVEGSAGTMQIPRDNYAQRYISFAKFRLGSVEFWAFNTHLPHNHNQASSRNTHARIAQMLLQKHEELGAGNLPTVITGDMNPFASNGASDGSFESNLVAAGFDKSYQARGNPGYSGLDKILHSRRHWTSSNGADQGTGRSDHPAIAVDLTLIQ